MEEKRTSGMFIVCCRCCCFILYNKICTVWVTTRSFTRSLSTLCVFEKYLQSHFSLWTETGVRCCAADTNSVVFSMFPISVGTESIQEECDSLQTMERLPSAVEVQLPDTHTETDDTLSFQMTTYYIIIISLRWHIWWYFVFSFSHQTHRPKPTVSSSY